MNFFQRQEKARKKTKIFILYFVLCIAFIIVGIYLAVLGTLSYLDSKSDVLDLSLWSPDLFYLVTGGTLLIVLLGSLFKIISLTGGGKIVAESVGGRKINPNTKNFQERQLLNVVEEMAIASGTPVPPVYLLREDGINAFAAGYAPKDAVIGVTRGTIEHLSRDELQGVIAHEFSHIFNGDMRMNIRLMGVLHGILIIAFLGYILLRTRGRKNPLPLLGLLLIVIGYAGIFFGRLIKAAISRQREYLADSSAVQFTRNPDGIGGALKKIGGLVQGSQIKHAKAEEVSHSYFANGIKQSWFQGLATHPSLVERIQRIDPQFDGKFPKVIPTPAQKGAKREATSANVPKGKFPIRIDEVIGQVGNPSAKHLLFAAALIGLLPEKIKEGVHDPFSARAVIYLLLLDKDPTIREKQIKILEKDADQAVFKEVQKLEGELNKIGPEARLPLIDMALPALQELSKKQYEMFRANIKKLVEADQKIDLFEFSLEQILLRHLDSHFQKRKKKRGARYDALHKLKSECAVLLSALAHFGNCSDSMAKSSFEKGRERLPLKGEPIQLLSKEETNIQALGKALDQLTLVAPKLQESLLEACAECVMADGEVTIEESELLRAIADAFEAPMPPLVA